MKGPVLRFRAPELAAEQLEDAIQAMKMLEWKALNKWATDLLGYIPEFVLADDPRPVAEQFNERYAHGGGWNPMENWQWDGEKSITYPGDPTLHAVAEALHPLTGETILVFPDAWVMIRQPNGSYEIAKMD